MNIDKYKLTLLPGYEYQIQLLRSMYEKSDMCYSKLFTLKSDIKDVEYKDVPIFIFEDIEVIDENNTVNCIKTINENTTIECVENIQLDKNKIVDDIYLSNIIKLAALESLAYSALQLKIMYIILSDCCDIYCKIEGTNLDKNKVNTITSIWTVNLYRKYLTLKRNKNNLISNLKLLLIKMGIIYYILTILNYAKFTIKF